MPSRTLRAGLGLAAAAVALVAGVRGTQDAIANGDTRTLTFVHAHTGEGATVTFRRNGRYDSEALNQLNWLLRDWRLDQPAKMDPRLFDIVWEVHRESGSREAVHVLSAYRAPETNAMLRRRSRGVSQHSQHMAGKAMDFRLPDSDMARVRAIAMRLQHGGVGYYPASNFVHVDSGSVRAWPRMSYEQLARLFPDGKTVHLPSKGKPLARYEEARAEILSRGGAVGGTPTEADDGGGSRRSLWATLFGGGDEDNEYYGDAERRRLVGARTATAYAPGSGDRTQVAAAEASPASGFRFPWQRAPAEQTPAPRRDAALLPEPLETASLPPMPPRRPDEVAFAFDVPIPPMRPVELASLGPAPASGRLGPAQDDRSALKALFVAAATPTQPPAAAQPAPVATSRATPRPIPRGGSSLLADLGPALNLRFSSAPTGDLVATAFTGPAVKPLPVLR